MRFKMIFSYLGTNYHGYQLQKGCSTVQGKLQDALEQVTGQHITLYASGRTDADVSALKQVAHFDFPHTITNLHKRLNLLLPLDIRIHEVQPVDDNFHARFSCTSKTYHYKFYLGKHSLPFLNQYAHFVPYKLNIQQMQKAAEYLVGLHDFTSFCAVGDESTNKTRRVLSTEIFSHDGVYTFSITGKSFLYNMVRIIMGTLIDVGRGKKKPSDISAILAAKDRTKAGATAPALGLVLVDVQY